MNVSIVSSGLSVSLNYEGDRKPPLKAVVFKSKSRLAHTIIPKETNIKH